MSPPDTHLLSNWLGSLGRKYALGHLALDDAGICVLSYGSSFDIIIQAIGGDDTVLIEIPLVSVPGVGREAFFRRVLSLNHRGEATRGASLSLNEQSQTVMLGWLGPIAQLDELAFEQLIGNLIDCAEAVRPLLDQVDPAHPIAASAAQGARLGEEAIRGTLPAEGYEHGAGHARDPGLGLRPGFLRG
jgi:hypothetical protein